MTLKLSAGRPHFSDLHPRITVIGVGGAGGNAVNNMIRLNLSGVEFMVANTDAQALGHSLVEDENRIQLGLNRTQGLGAGSQPDVGSAAAEEAIEEVRERLGGAHMVFITAGMGGGTGTGAAPVIAKAARELGILTVGVVTKPFHFEGTRRMRLAENGIEELTKQVDTLIIIPNQNLFRIATERTTFAEAFAMADNVLYSGVRGVTDLMVKPGLINLDFADIRTVMSEMGKAMMGTGEAEGDKRSIMAAEAAISNPLLDDISMKGARGILINITGGNDMTLFEVDEAANRIRDEVDPDANIIFGATFDETMEGRMRVSVVSTGIDAHIEAAQPEPHTLRVVMGGGRQDAPVAPVSVVAAGAAMAGARPGPAPMHMTAQTVGNTALQHEVAPPQPAVQQPPPAATQAPMTAAQPQPAAPVAEPPRGQVGPGAGFMAPQPVLPPAGHFAANQPTEPQAPAPRKSGLSIFKRVAGSMTGAGRSHAAAEPAPRVAPTAMPATQAEPAAPPPAAAPAPAAAAPAPAAPRVEDATLDIPAFLRKQVN